MMRKTVVIMVSFFLILQAAIPAWAEEDISFDAMSAEAVSEEVVDNLPEAEEETPSAAEEEKAEEATAPEKEEAAPKDDTNAEKDDAASSEPVPELTYKCKDFTITANGQFEEGTGLVAEPLDPEKDDLEQYEKDTAEKVKEDLDETVRSMDLYDIYLLRDDERIEPSEDVTITITYKKKLKDPDRMRIVHFRQEENTEEPVLLDTETTDREITFSTDSFSIYAVVEIEEPAAPETVPAEAVTDLDGGNFYLSITKNNTNRAYYFRDTITDGNKIAKTGANDLSSAAVWSFEKVSGSDNRYVIFRKEIDDSRTYMCMDDSGNMSLSQDAGTEFTVTLYNDQSGRFYIYKEVGSKKYGLNMFGGERGKGFAGWDGKDDGSVIVLSKIPEEKDDPLGLDGKSYGLANMNKNKAIAMMADAMGNGTHLQAKPLRPAVHPLTGEDVLFKDEGDVPFWTFRNLFGSAYHITTEKDGALKYLRITDSSITLTDTPDNSCILQVDRGSGAYEGLIRISNAAGYSPNLYSGSIANGFGPYNDKGPNEWFAPIDLTDLLDADYGKVQATKVSVSNRTQMPDGAKVIIYTRIWNPDSREYDLYAINHEGNLFRVYDTGDRIEWMGLKDSNLLWDFTEYHYEGTETPNYYYEFQNVYSGKYLAPQKENGQVLSDSPVGVNLSGRRYGEYYSSIIAWDDANYAYAGLLAEDGELVSSPITKLSDFYFAIITEDEEEDRLTPLETINGTAHGIKMRLVNFNGNSVQNSLLGSSEGGGVNTTVDGLLDPQLGDDGYPVAAKTGRSFSELFSNAQAVDHLFLASTYNSTGYYEFDSTKSFASLQPDGKFIVYHELGTSDAGTQLALDHGQFLPYNTIKPGVFAVKHPENLYDATTKELPETDPRKYEKLHLVEKADYHFGMEIEASFVQTPSGLDNWGHDIIYTFTGDDDFWLFVDGELVIDLGGIHNALPGSINYSTGEVVVNGEPTTLYEIFRQNYEKKNPSATEAETEEYLNGLFELNEKGQHLFKDYSTHTMKLYFMERGAGASNLNMKFNLSSVKPGQVILNKQLSGMENRDYRLAEYGYQVYYQLESDGPYRLLERLDEHSRVTATYGNSNDPVRYKSSFTPAGSSVSYNNVFFLKPSETAVFNIPEEVINYKIREVGVNTQVYDEVRINDELVTGSAAGSNRMDFETTPAHVYERPRVVFDNHVSSNAERTMTITKRLFDADDSPVHNDSTGFNFRLYLGTENDPDPPAASTHDYQVKDPSGNYCIWDTEAQKFRSLGKSDFSKLSASEKYAATFQTSPSGAISRIPADYKVEVRGLLIGTSFRIEERKSEIPAGYSFIRYRREGSSYIIYGDDENSGTIRANESPAIEIDNRRGFGLTVKKVWTDNSVVRSHDAVYFGIYRNGTLIEDSVRELSPGQSSLYWYFDRLGPGLTISDYSIRELRLTGDYSVADTVVTGDFTAAPILEGTKEEYGSTSKQGPSGIGLYSISYETGEITGTAHNARTDTVTNTRIGINMFKESPGGTGLQGARFSLAGNGESYDYTSDQSGLLGTAYVYLNKAYTVTELAAPAGYQCIDESAQVRMDALGNVSMTGGGEAYTVSAGAAGGFPELHIKNRPITLSVIKKNAYNELLEGAHFSLYKETIKDGIPVPATKPVSGYSDMTTDAAGVLSGMDAALPSGTYYLYETLAPSGYERLPAPVRLTIDPLGRITVDPSLYADLTTAEGTSVDYTLTITDDEMQDVVPSGFMQDKGPYIMLLAAAAVVLLISAAFALSADRRKERDDVK